MTELTLEDFEARRQEWSEIYGHLENRKCFLCGEWFKVKNAQGRRSMCCSDRCRSHTSNLLQQLRNPIQSDWVLDMATMTWKNLKTGEVEVDREDS